MNIPNSKSETVQPTVNNTIMNATFKKACTIPSLWYDLQKAYVAKIACT